MSARGPQEGGYVFETGTIPRVPAVEPATSLSTAPAPRGKPAEPALKVGAVVGVVTAALVLLTAFGVGITDVQSQAIVALVVAMAGLGPFVSGWVTRGKVSPTQGPEHRA